MNAHLEDHVYPDGYGRTHLDKPFWIVRCDNHEGGAWLLNSGHHYDDRDAALAKAAEHDVEHHVPEHKSRVYVDDRDSGTYAYRCTGCELREGGYLVAPYARDGWREAHGLDPLVNYPMV